MTTRIKCWVGCFVVVCLAVWATESVLAGERRGRQRDNEQNQPDKLEQPGDQPVIAPDPAWRDWRRGDRRPEHRRPFFDRLPEEERERVHTFISEHFPEAARELRRAFHSNPRTGERRFRRLFPEMLRLMRSFEEDPPELFGLRIDEAKNELEMRKIMRFYRHADEPRRQELRTELRERVEHAFDLRQQIGRMDIERLERGITELHKRLERDAKNRDRIIERQLERRLSPIAKQHKRPRHPGPPPEPRPEPDRLPPPLPPSEPE